MSSKIFYFTGTGNSLHVAQDMAKAIGDCETINIARFDASQGIEAERVGIVFPVYFWGPPLIVQRFLRKIQLTGNPYVFAICTYGIWPGKALELAGDILRQRGFPLNAGFFIKMPDNYILWYGAKSEKVQKKCFDRETQKIDRISKSIISKENTSLEKSKYVIDRLLTKTVNKRSAKRYAATSDKFTVSDDCIGCGLCERICPAGNIWLDEQKPIWEHQCEACLACIQRCPKQAINYNNKTQKRKRYINPNIKFKN